MPVGLYNHCQNPVLNIFRQSLCFLDIQETFNHSCIGLLAWEYCSYCVHTLSTNAQRCSFISPWNDNVPINFRFKSCTWVSPRKNECQNFYTKNSFFTFFSFVFQYRFVTSFFYFAIAIIPFGNLSPLSNKGYSTILSGGPTDVNSGCLTRCVEPIRSRILPKPSIFSHSLSRAFFHSSEKS